VFEPSKKTNCVITLNTTMGIFCDFCFCFVLLEKNADFKSAKNIHLDATKNLNLVENEPVKSKAVEREQEEVINENSTTDHGLNSLDNSAMQKAYFS
jgi:hypothetical protein